MLIKHECYKARSEVTAFTLLNDGTLAFSTKIHGAKIFSHLRCSAIKNLSIDLLGHKTTAVSFSKEADLLAFANANIIYIINTQNKLLIQTIRTYEGDIELLEFVPNTKYLVTGTKHGRVMQYRYDGRLGISRLCSFALHMQNRQRSKNNYVSAFAFHENIFATTGYGGTITILKMNTYTNRYNIEASKVRINALCFLDASHIVSGNIDGVVSIHSLKKYQASKTISTHFSHINSIVLMPNPQFIMVSGASKELVLIDIQKGKVVSTSYLSFAKNVSKIRLTKDNNLLILLESQQFMKVKLPTAQDIKEFLLHNELEKAYSTIENDPMLQGTREHKRVEVMYEKLYTQAINALIDSNTKEARKLLHMFSNVTSKKSDIQSIFRAFEYYPRFINLYLEKKHALAYAMAEKYPALKRTQQYKKMEEKFKETYTFAQKQILLGRDDVAKEILSMYATVLSKKPLLNLVLKQNKDFIAFLKAVNEKDFATLERLLKSNETFAQIPSFTALKNESENALKKIQIYINDGQADAAVSLIKQHLNTPSIKEELQRLYSDTKLVKKLHKSYEENDFNRCYEILDSSMSLDSLKLAKLLETHYSKLIDQAEEFALKGDLKGIKKVLGGLINIQSRVDKIGDIIRMSFHTKIKVLMAKRSFKNAQSVIYSYIDIFGQDSEIILIMRSFEKVVGKKLALTQEQDKRVPRDNWRNSSLIMS